MEAAEATASAAYSSSACSSVCICVFPKLENKLKSRVRRKHLFTHAGTQRAGSIACVTNALIELFLHFVFQFGKNADANAAASAVLV